MKWIQTILPILVLVATVLAPQVQGLISAHPTVAVILAAVLSVLNHLTPSPVASTSAK